MIKCKKVHQMWHDHTCSARELEQQKEQWRWGWGLEMTGKWERGWTKLEKKGVGNVEGLNKIGG